MKMVIRSIIRKASLFILTMPFLFFSVANGQQQILVKNMVELQEAVSVAKPGTVILLSDGIYQSEEITLSANGDAANPIIIQANTLGKAIFQSPIKLNGDFLSIISVQFNEKGNVQISGRGCRISRCTFSDVKTGKWVRILPGSSNIEIDHNIFQNKKINLELERGCQLLQIVVRNKNEQHHIHHNLFHDIPQGSGNGFETVQLITENNPFDPPSGSCNTVIENNLFERCNGESEIISVKSNGNLIRGNTFRACRGALVLRHGDDNVVTGNYFFGDGEKGSGGVRLQGTGQVVANNYFYNLEQFGVGMMDGTPDDLYIRVERASIVFNTFINCNKTMEVGLNHSNHPNGTVPKNCNITGNIYYSDNNHNDDQLFIIFVQGDQPEGWKWVDNVAFGKPMLKKIKGIQAKNPHLKFLENGLAVPSKKTLSANQSVISKYTEVDLFGVKRGEKKTIGAIQFPVNGFGNGPLTEEKVGPNVVKPITM